MKDARRLANAVKEAAREFNVAVSDAADAGLLVEVTLVDDPDITKGATPRPMLDIAVHGTGEQSLRIGKELTA